MIIDLSIEEIKILILSLDKSLPTNIYLTSPMFLLQLKLKVLLDK